MVSIGEVMFSGDFLLKLLVFPMRWPEPKLSRLEFPISPRYCPLCLCWAHIPAFPRRMGFLKRGAFDVKQGRYQPNGDELVPLCVTHCLLPSDGEFFTHGCAFGGGWLVGKWPGLIQLLDAVHLHCLCPSRSPIQEARSQVLSSLRPLALH